MPFRRKFRKPFRRNASSSSSKKRVSFKRRSFKRGSSLKTSVRGVAGTVYNSYSKPRTTLRKVNRIVNRKINEIKNVANPVYLPQQYGQQWNTTTTGVSLLAIIGQVYDNGDLNSIVNALTVINSAPAYEAPRKFVVDGFRGQYTMKNNTNVDLEMDLYWCLARRDISTNAVPFATFGNAVQYSDIRQVLLDGAAEQDLTLTTTTWSNAITPFQITRFCELFNILKSKRVLLGGGRNTTVKLNLPKKHMFETDLISGIVNGSPAPTYSCYGGKTMTLLAIVRGEIVNDSTTKSNVSTSTVQFNLLGEESYTAYPNNVQPTRLVPATALSTITTNMIITQETELVTAQTTT